MVCYDVCKPIEKTSLHMQSSSDMHVSLLHAGSRQLLLLPLTTAHASENCIFAADCMQRMPVQKAYLPADCMHVPFLNNTLMWIVLTGMQRCCAARLLEQGQHSSAQQVTHLKTSQRKIDSRMPLARACSMPARLSGKVLLPGNGLAVDTKAAGGAFSPNSRHRLRGGHLEEVPTYRRRKRSTRDRKN